MKRIIISIAAASVLVAGAFVASTIPGTEASAQTDDAPAATDEVRRPHRGAILDQVLSDLVEDGTLDQDQADAVKDGLAAKRAELKEEYGDRRDRRREFHDEIQSWLEDGVITEDELSELPFDLPRSEDGPLAEALEDGEITQEEWDAFLEGRKANRQARRGAFLGSVAS
jgi:polyhydroxyalkanoate synthesis regulator phasin